MLKIICCVNSPIRFFASIISWIFNFLYESGIDMNGRILSSRILEFTKFVPTSNGILPIFCKKIKIHSNHLSRDVYTQIWHIIQKILYRVRFYYIFVGTKYIKGSYFVRDFSSNDVPTNMKMFDAAGGSATMIDG